MGRGTGGAKGCSEPVRPRGAGQSGGWRHVGLDSERGCRHMGLGVTSSLVGAGGQEGGAEERHWELEPIGGTVFSSLNCAVLCITAFVLVTHFLEFPVCPYSPLNALPL